MNRDDFLLELKSKLSGYPKEDVDKTLSYYNEIIADKIEDGMDEEEAVNSIGSIDMIINNFLKEIPLKKLVCGKLKNSKKLKTWQIAVISATGIIWFPILIALICSAFVIYVSLWSIIISLIATGVALAASSLIFFVGLINIFTGHIGSGYLLISAGLIFLGLGILIFIGSKELSKLMVKATKLFCIKKKFIKLGENNEI